MSILSNNIIYNLQNFEEGVLFNMTIEDSLHFELFDPHSQRYLVANSIQDCGFGQLKLVKIDDSARNSSGFKIYSQEAGEYFEGGISCC